MARPEKQGLDYFPLDVNLDDKVKLIEAKFGLVGFAVLVKLWQIIYENSYFVKWTERELLLYKNRINADINLINDVINESIRWGLFNEELYKKYQILTSSGIQKRYLEATKRRKNVVVEKSYTMIDLTQFENVEVVNVDINPIDSYISTQSKVNRKEKENKKKTYSQENQALATAVITYLNERAGKKYKDNVPLTLSHIGQRCNDGYVLEDFKEVIDTKVEEWLNDPHYQKYLRPETLFGNKFDSYLNQNKKNKPIDRQVKPDPIQEQIEKPGTIFIDIEELMKEGGIDGLDGIGKQERKNW